MLRFPSGMAHVFLFLLLLLLLLLIIIIIIIMIIIKARNRSFPINTLSALIRKCVIFLHVGVFALELPVAP